MATPNNKHWMDSSEMGKGVAFAMIVSLALVSIFLIAKTVNTIKSYPTIGQDNTVNSSISVTGKGEVNAIPNMGTFSFTISENAATIQSAQAKASDKSQKALAFLKQSGIDDKDIQTNSYQTGPHYNNYISQPIICTSKVCPPSVPKTSGFEVNQTITVKVRKVDGASALIAGIGGLGITNIGDLSLSLDNQDELQSQARDAAIIDARVKAIHLANTLGVHLGKVSSFSDSYSPMPTYASVYGSMAKSVDAAPVPALPVGENKVTSEVNITYQIN